MEFGNDNYAAYPAKTWPARVAGAGVALLCLLLLISLLTYDINEMGWSFLNPGGAEAAAAVPCTNFLGLAGLYLSGLLYALFGAVAVYGVALAGGIGVGMLIQPRGRRTSQWIALCALVICSCAFLSIQPWILTEWAKGLNLDGPGGKLGYLDGTCIAEPLLGARWSMSLALLAHAIALVYYCRLTPKDIYLSTKSDVCALACRVKESRRRKKEERQYAQMQWKTALPPQPEQPVAPPANAAAPALSMVPSPAEPAPQRPVSPEPPSRASLMQPRPASAHLPSPERQAPRPAEPMRTNAPNGSLPPRQLPGIQPTHAQPVPPSRLGQRNQAERDSAPDIYTERDTEDPPLQPRQPLSARKPLPPLQHSTGDNLLDLMGKVEEDIENESDMRFGEHARLLMPLNASLEKATNKRFGFLQEKEPEPEPRARAIAPKPAPPRPEPLHAEIRNELSDYQLPPYDLLEYQPVPAALTEAVREEKERIQNLIIETLDTFKINVEPGPITRGPSFTRYEFFPPKGLRVNRIANLHNDLMLATQSETLNILAPVPGRNTVGIELANETKSPVYLRELLQSEEFHNPKLRIPVALGKNVYGTPVIGDLAAMPHTLVAGTTGSGKSVCINSMILSMLYKFRPDELKLILVDPKVVEMQPYRKLPHLACPVVTEPARVIGALRWAVNEMEHRYRMFSKMGVRNFEDFNNRPEDYVPEPEEEEMPEEDYDPLPQGFSAADAIVRDIEDSQGCDLEEEEQGELDFEAEERIPAKIPYIVIIIDELADLMQLVKEDLENYIARLTQKARAAGIHLVVATQTPRAQVLTGTIKANIPCRIALKVSSPLDSRIILDATGAENLLGKGDLLFLPPGGITKLCRAQGAFVSDAEIASIIKFCASQAKQHFEQGVTAEMNNADGSQPDGDNGGRIGGKGMSDEDAELYTRCVNLVVTERKASTSLLQRRFSIGYGRAAKIMDLMEARGVIGPSLGASRPREVLVDAP